MEALKRDLGTARIKRLDRGIAASAWKFCFTDLRYRRPEVLIVTQAKFDKQEEAQSEIIWLKGGEQE